MPPAQPPERAATSKAAASPGADALPPAASRPAPTVQEAKTAHVEAKKALAHAEYRLKEGQDSLDMPDMSNCVIS